MIGDLHMSIDELLALPVSVDLITAGRAFGFGRTKAHELARAGEFPCRVIPVGRRQDGTPFKYRVARAAIFEVLGIKEALPVMPSGDPSSRPAA